MFSSAGFDCKIGRQETAAGFICIARCYKKRHNSFILLGENHESRGKYFEFGYSRRTCLRL